MEEQPKQKNMPDYLEIDAIKQQKFTDITSMVRHILMLFSQTSEDKKIVEDYVKTQHIIKIIEDTIRKVLWHNDPNMVNLRTKSYYHELDKLGYKEIYALCDFVMKNSVSWERDIQRMPLLYEVLYIYATDMTYWNCSLDCKKVVLILREHGVYEHADIIENVLAWLDKRVYWSIITTTFDVENQTVTFQNANSGVLGVLNIESELWDM